MLIVQKKQALLIVHIVDGENNVLFDQGQYVLHIDVFSFADKRMKFTTRLDLSSMVDVEVSGLNINFTVDTAQETIDIPFSVRLKMDTCCNLPEYGKFSYSIDGVGDTVYVYPGRLGLSVFSPYIDTENKSTHTLGLELTDWSNVPITSTRSPFLNTFTLVPALYYSKVNPKTFNVDFKMARDPYERTWIINDLLQFFNEYITANFYTRNNKRNLNFDGYHINTNCEVDFHTIFRKMIINSVYTVNYDFYQRFWYVSHDNATIALGDTSVPTGTITNEVLYGISPILCEFNRGERQIAVPAYFIMTGHIKSNGYNNVIDINDVNYDTTIHVDILTNDRLYGVFILDIVSQKIYILWYEFVPNFFLIGDFNYKSTGPELYTDMKYIPAYEIDVDDTPALDTTPIKFGACYNKNIDWWEDYEHSHSENGGQIFIEAGRTYSDHGSNYSHRGGEFIQNNTHYNINSFKHSNDAGMMNWKRWFSRPEKIKDHVEIHTEVDRISKVFYSKPILVWYSQSSDREYDINSHFDPLIYDDSKLEVQGPVEVHNVFYCPTV